MNTNTGVTFAVGIGLMTNVRCSFSFDFFDLPGCFFLGDFRREDLKLPLRGNLTIHDGGTIMLECVPENRTPDSKLLNGIQILRPIEHRI